MTKMYYSDYNTVYSCQYHIIFSTKYRKKLLVNQIDIRLKELIYLKQSDYNYKVIELEIMPEHIHLLLDINPRYLIKTIISKIKGYTSKILRTEFKYLKRYKSLWTTSIFISTVGTVSLETVKNYIENQKL